VQTAEREICSLVEWYICECIQYGPAKIGGWWSDGIVHLEITEVAQNSFKLLGVTWIDCHGVAPFEIDLELVETDDQYFAKTVVRLGTLDDRGLPKLFHRRIDPRSIVQARPRENRDWAMAVELTPPAKTED
jgi:hypothetical protein